MSHADNRVNGRVAEITETGAALRWKLERADLEHCDAYATPQSPDPLQDGDPVEVKACRVTVSNGDSYGTKGRWWIHKTSHNRLLEERGYYALVLYDKIPIDEGNRWGLLAIGVALISARELDQLLPGSPGDVAKLRWDEVFSSYV